MADGPWAGGPRTTASRGDIAAKHLEGKVAAQRYVEGTLYEVTAAKAPLREHPRFDASLDTEALKGERVMIYDHNDEGWSWGQLVQDDYVGWLPTEALQRAGATPTYTVSALRTFAFPGPDIKLAPVETLSLGCKIRVARTAPPFAVTSQDTYVPICHLGDSTYQETDFVAVAERFVGTPYLWGGRTSLGIDCSGLVQVSLAATGIVWPRDTGMQESLGHFIEPYDDFSNVLRGDLIFWHGHVAVVRGEGTLIHANAHHMAVTIEPIRQVIMRALRSDRRDIVSVRRIVQPAQ